MARGLIAPLSPNEEVTLRRIASGQTAQALLAARDVINLTSLGLAEIVDGKLRLTGLGRERHAQLADAPPVASAEFADVADAALVESYTKARREPSAAPDSRTNRRAP